jgi:hypothetical protein
MRCAVLASAVCFALSAALPAAAAASACAPVETFAPGVISTDDHWEWRLSFVPSGRQAYWATSVGWWPGTREQAYIMTSEQRRGGWTAPRVAPFSGVHSDFDPFVSPDGMTLYFSSMRPVNGQEKTDMDLWKVSRTATGEWGTPVHLGNEVNAEGYDELYSSVDNQGNLYFARVMAPVPLEDVDIWRSKRRADGSYGAPEKLGPGVNTPERWEFNPEISPDGRTLLFVRLDLPWDDLPDAGYGFGDIYVSRKQGTRANADFGAGVNLGPCINTENDEFHPTMRWRENVLYFAQDAGAPSDFHRTTVVLP